MARDHGDDWELADGEQLSTECPRSFFIPKRSERDDLKPGHLVKLVFRRTGVIGDGPSAERMWVTVTSRSDDGRYVGELTNQPAAIGDLRRGDDVAFGPEHVATIYSESAVPDNVRAFASRRLIDDPLLEPGFVYHDPSDLDMPPKANGDRLSGWALMAGDETEEEISKPANVLAPSLGWLCERYPAFGRLVEASGHGRQYELRDGDYVDVGPYEAAEE